LSRKKKFINNTGIPDYAIEAFARCLLPDILADFENEDVLREFEQWKAEQIQKPQKSEMKAA